MIKHFLSIEDLSKSEIEFLIERGNHYLENNNSEILKGKFLYNVFFEESTRTITSFQTAGMRLGASVINLNMKSSSISKGETEIDTIKNIDAMEASFIAIRHNKSMTPHICSKYVQNAKIINAGDGTNEHPSQALGDLLTMYNYVVNKNFKALRDLKIVIYGDIKNSRVAHSHIKLYNILGIKNVHLVAPPELMYEYHDMYPNLKYHYKLNDALEGTDLIIALRVKTEYDCSLSGVMDEFKSFYSLNHNKLLEYKVSSNVKIMHPGPVNRGVELSGELVDDLKYSLIMKQVSCGVAMRQAMIEKMFVDED